MVWDDPYIMMVVVSNNTATSVLNQTTLFKIDTAGNIIDSNTVFRFTEAVELIKGQNNDYLCMGIDVDSISPGQGSLLTPTVFAFDDNLTVQWKKQYFDLHPAGGYAANVVQSYNGGYAMTIALGFNSDYESYLLEVDGFGDSINSVLLTQDTTATLNGLSRTLDGGYITVGGQDDGQPLPLLMLQKLDANLTPIWNRTYTTPLGALAADVISMPDGGYIFGGTIFTNNDYDQAGYLAKVDGMGDMLWETTLPAQGYYDVIFRLRLALNNQILAIGLSETLNGDETILQSRIIDTTLTTAIETVEIGELLLYPNPVSDVLTLELEKPLPQGMVTITNQLGQQITSFTLTDANRYEVSAPSYPGIYYLTVHGADGSYTLRFLKQ